jgi:tripartite-type tricarboxylate transporter receptor subunit TctC
MTNRRAACFLALAVCCSGTGWVQGFTPTRPAELVVHSASGGGSAGASAEAMAYLAGKRGDDHTLAVFTNTWLTTPLTRKDPPRTLRDFTLLRLQSEIPAR